MRARIELLLKQQKLTKNDVKNILQVLASELLTRKWQQLKLSIILVYALPVKLASLGSFC